MPKIPYGRKKDLIQELKATGKTPAQIIKTLKEKGVKANPSYVYEIYSRKEEPKSPINTILDRAKPQKEKPTGETKPIETTEQPIKVPTELESASEETPLLKETMQKMEEGTLTGEDLKALFQAVNETYGNLLGEKYKPSDGSASLMGKVASKPFNRLLDKATESNENIDIVLLATVAAIIYLPPLGLYAKDKADEKKKKGKDKLKELEKGEKERNA